MDETEGIAPTLRDQFAMAALTGLLAGRNGMAAYDHWWAAEAYALADAMLAERDKVKP